MYLVAVLMCDDSVMTDDISVSDSLVCFFRFSTSFEEEERREEK